MKDNEFNAANEFNEMLKNVKNDADRKDLIDVSIQGICFHCGAVVNDKYCSCMRDE